MSGLVDSPDVQADAVYSIAILLGLDPVNGQSKVMSGHCGAAETHAETFHCWCSCMERHNATGCLSVHVPYAQELSYHHDGFPPTPWHCHHHNIWYVVYLNHYWCGFLPPPHQRRVRHAKLQNFMMHVHIWGLIFIFLYKHWLWLMCFLVFLHHHSPTYLVLFTLALFFFTNVKVFF